MSVDEGGIDSVAIDGDRVPIGNHLVVHLAGFLATLRCRVPLLGQLHALEAQPLNTAAVGPTVSRASFQADLANSQPRAARLTAHVQQLEKRLSEILGEKA
jgi:hypothetical protein